MDDYPVDLIQQGAVESVFTTHVTHQQQFFVHLESRSKILEDIMCKLEDRYTDSKLGDKPLHSKRIGSPCAVKFTDDNLWYRAKITGIMKNGLIEVHFVDFGNVDYVSEDRVKAIDPDLVMYPVQCYRCSLANVSCPQGFWTPELIIQFEDLVVDRKCRAVFMEENDEVYLLQMYDSDGTNINELFGGRGPAPAAPVPQSATFQEVSFEVGTVFQATVVYVKSPELFWCQDIAFVNDVLIMSEELSRLHMTQDVAPLTEVNRGTICAAKSSEDEGWYRSIVQATSGHTAQVYFVDYGNSETVSLDVLCNLKPEMRTLPVLGTKCCLAGVEKRQWQQEILEKFEQLVMDKEFEVKVVGKEGDVYIVTLLDIVENKDVRFQLQPALNSFKVDKTQPDINSNKQQKSSAAPTAGPSIDVGSTVSVFLSWIESPGDFWVQNAESEGLLEGLSQRLQEVYAQQQPLARPSPGAFVVARFSQDHNWYRSLVLKALEGDLVQVMFIDYGNTDIIPVTELRQVGPQFGQLIPLASRCCLLGVRSLCKGDKSWVTDAKDFLESFTENGCQCEVLSSTDSHKLVKLKVGSQDAARELLELGLVADATPDSKRAQLFDGDKHTSDHPKRSSNIPKQVVGAVDFHAAKEIPLGSTFEAFASVVVSPSKFFIQQSGVDEVLEDLADTISQHYVSGSPPPSIPDPHAGQACVALYSDDAHWYRGHVTAVNASSCNVVFVDYGNEDTVLHENIKVATPDVARLPIMAYQCCLHGVQETQWSESAVEFFESLVMDQKLDCKFLAAASVSISCRGQDVASQLVNAGYCKPHKSVQSSGEGLASREQSEVGTNHWQKEADSRGTAPHRRGEDRREPKSYIEHDVRREPKSYIEHDVRREPKSYIEHDVRREPKSYIEHDVRREPKSYIEHDVRREPKSYIEHDVRREPKSYIEHDDRSNDKHRGDAYQTENSRGFNERPRTVNGASHVGSNGRDSAPVRDLRPGGTKSSGEPRYRDNEESRFGGSRADRKTSSDHGSVTGTDFTYADVTSEPPQSAILVHMDESGVFYIQLPSMEKDILFLSKRIAGSYKAGSGPRLKERPGTGTVCCAKFSGDGNMYRARIEYIEGSSAVLRYVDYGNTGECNVNDLKILFPDLLQYPVQAFPCSLRGYTWSLDHAEQFARAALDKDLTVTFTNTTCPFEVDIRTPEGDLLEMLTGVSAPQKLVPKAAETSSRPAGFGSKVTNTGQSGDRSLTGTNQELLPEQEFKHASPPPGPLAAFISSVEQDGYFYLQLSRDSTAIESIAEKLMVLPENTRHPNPCQGASCAAVFSEDSVWYRARIMETKGDSLSVVFVDYGNQDMVSASSVKPLSLELLSLPPLAYQCQFPEVGPLTPEAQARLAAYLNELEVTVTFSATSAPFDVSVKTADGDDLLDLICPTKQYRAQSVPREVTPAGVTHIENDGRFFLQLYQDRSALRDLQDDLHTICEAGAAPTLEALDAGTPCCVKLEDASWQRGQLIHTTDQHAKVLLVDTSKTVTTGLHSLRALPTHFLKQPPFSFECCLNGVSGWTEDMHSKFVQMTEGKVLNASFSSQSPPFSVSLSRSIELDLLELAAPGLSPNTSPQRQPTCEAAPGLSPQTSPQRQPTCEAAPGLSPQTSPQRQPTCEAAPGAESEVASRTATAFISHVEPSGVFYSQSEDSDLTQLADTLDDLLKDTSRPSQVTVGDVLCARFTDDDCWYRARIESCTDDDMYRVRFVDFGNVDLVDMDRLALLPASLDLTLVPALATKCQLFDAPDNLSSDQADRFRQAVADQTLSVLFRGEKDGVHMVQVYLDGVDLTQSLGLTVDTSPADLSAEDGDGSLDKSQVESLTVQAAAMDETTETTSSNIGLELAFLDVTERNLASIQRASVSISYVCSPDRFYIQLEDSKAGLNEMMDVLFQHCSSPPEAAQPADFHVGDVCAALYEDGSWYRVKIIADAEEGTFQILYMDYGNTAYAGLADLQQLPDKFKQKLPWAIQAALGGVAAPGGDWTEEALQQFKAMVEDKCLLADILEVSQNGTECVVHLLSMGIPVHEELIRKGYAVAGEGIAVNKCVQQFFSDSESYIAETVVEDLTDCLESTHLGGDSNVMTEEFGGCLESTHLGDSNVMTEEFGGCLESTHLGDSNVMTEEFGGCLESTHLEGDSRTAKETMMGSGAHAHQKLECVSSSLDELQEIVVRVSHSASPSLFWCQLSSCSNVLSDISHSLASALSSLSPVREAPHEGDVVVAVCPGSGQLYRARVLSARPSDAGEANEKLRVRFVDCGDESQVSQTQVLEIPDSLSVWPAQAFPCCLDKCQSIGQTWSAQACLSFSEMVAQQELLLKLVSRKQDGTVVGKLVLRETGQSVHSLLEQSALDTTETCTKSLETTKVLEVSETEALEMPQPIMESTVMVTDNTRGSTPVFTFEKATDDLFRSVRLSLHTEYDVTVSNDELPSSFHVRLLELTDQYTTLMAEIADLTASSCLDVADLQPGDACLVQHCGVWYRGLVSARDSTSWNVQSVDCGWLVNVSSTELKALPDHLKELPAQAIPCYLAGIVSVDPEWSTAAISFFMDSVRASKLCLYVLETADDGKFGVYLNDLAGTSAQSVNRDLVDIGFAEVVPGSNIEVQMEMEKTLDTDMLNDLEESFNEVSQLKCNAHSTSGAQAFPASTLDSPGDFYHGGCEIGDGKPGTSLPLSTEEPLPVQIAEFDFASAVDKIDQMGCVEDYPEECLFPGCEGLEEQSSQASSLLTTSAGLEGLSATDETSEFSGTSQPARRHSNDHHSGIAAPVETTSDDSESCCEGENLPAGEMSSCLTEVSEESNESYDTSSLVFSDNLMHSSMDISSWDVGHSTYNSTFESSHDPCSTSTLDSSLSTDSSSSSTSAATLSSQSQSDCSTSAWTMSETSSSSTDASCEVPTCGFELEQENHPVGSQCQQVHDGATYILCDKVNLSPSSEGYLDEVTHPQESEDKDLSPSSQGYLDEVTHPQESEDKDLSPSSQGYLDEVTHPQESGDKDVSPSSKGYLDEVPQESEDKDLSPSSKGYLDEVTHPQESEDMDLSPSSEGYLDEVTHPHDSGDKDSNFTLGDNNVVVMDEEDIEKLLVEDLVPESYLHLVRVEESSASFSEDIQPMWVSAMPDRGSCLSLTSGESKKLQACQERAEGEAYCGISRSEVSSRDISPVDEQTAGVSSRDISPVDEQTAEVSSRDISPVDEQAAGVSSRDISPVDEQTAGVSSRDISPVDEQTAGVSSRDISPVDEQTAGVSSRDISPVDEQTAGVSSQDISPVDEQTAGVSSRDISPVDEQTAGDTNVCHSLEQRQPEVSEESEREMADLGPDQRAADPPPFHEHSEHIPLSDGTDQQGSELLTAKEDAPVNGDGQA